MESKVYVRMSPNTANKLLDSRKLNIRFITPVKDKDVDFFDYDAPLRYKVVVRHSDKEVAEDLITDAVKSLKERKEIGFPPH